MPSSSERRMRGRRSAADAGPARMTATSAIPAALAKAPTLRRLDPVIAVAPCAASRGAAPLYCCLVLRVPGVPGAHRPESGAMGLALRRLRPCHPRAAGGRRARGPARLRRRDHRPPGDAAAHRGALDGPGTGPAAPLAAVVHRPHAGPGGSAFRGGAMGGLALRRGLLGGGDGRLLPRLAGRLLPLPAAADLLHALDHAWSLSSVTDRPFYPANRVRARCP